MASCFASYVLGFECLGDVVEDDLFEVDAHCGGGGFGCVDGARPGVEGEVFGGVYEAGEVCDGGAFGDGVGEFDKPFVERFRGVWVGENGGVGGEVVVECGEESGRVYCVFHGLVV